MKIISPFKDYYDSVAYTYGIDDRNVFVRKTETFTVKKDILNTAYDFNFLIHQYISERIGTYRRRVILASHGVFIFGFCGKLHLGYYRVKGDINSFFSVGNHNDGNIELAENDIITFDREEFDKSYPTTYSKLNWNYCDSDGRIQQYLSLTDKANLFEKFNTPYFVVTYDTIIINPLLKGNIKYQNVLPVDQAYQEIEMFLSLLNNHEKETPLDDKSKIQQYGFDDKLSFRKEK